MKKDYRTAPLNSSDKAMLDYAVKLTRSPDNMQEQDVRSLREHGFSDVAILEIVHVAAYFNYINRVADGLGIDPEPEWPAQGS